MKGFYFTTLPNFNIRRRKNKNGKKLQNSPFSFETSRQYCHQTVLRLWCLLAKISDLIEITISNSLPPPPPHYTIITCFLRIFLSIFLTVLLMPWIGAQRNLISGVNVSFLQTHFLEVFHIISWKILGLIPVSLEKIIYNKSILYHRSCTFNYRLFLPEGKVCSPLSRVIHAV